MSFFHAEFLMGIPMVFGQASEAAENLANQPTSGRSIWSVSQAAPLRRVQVIGHSAAIDQQWAF
jgi:hypothetical protein